MITIVLVDDHQIVRKGIKSLLETESDLKVIGEAGEGEEAVRLVEKLHPDILVTDLVMGAMNGIEVTRQVCQVCPKTRVILLSMYGSEAYVLEALRAGASGYVLKGSSLEDLELAIHEVSCGKRYLSPPLSEESIETYRRHTESNQRKCGGG